MDRDRTNGREDDSCEFPFAPNTPRPNPARPVPPCDPPDDPVEPEFIEPLIVSPDPPVVYRSPDAVELASIATTATCNEWPLVPEGESAPTGPDVSLPAGQFTAPWYFESVDSLTVKELDRIAKVMDTSAADFLAYVAADNAGSIAVLFSLPIPKAAAILANINAEQLALNASAHELAVAQLSCTWKNPQLTLSCADLYPPGEYGTAMTTAPGNNPVVIAAGTYTSTISQADATQQARDAAALVLVCVWGNDPLTLFCSNIGFDALDPTDVNPLTGNAIGVENGGSTGQVYPQNPSRRRVNKVVIAANTIRSSLSKADANQQALSNAQAALDCFYVNPLLVVSCDDLNHTTDAGYHQNPVIYGQAERGNPVTVPAVTFASDASWADATEQARNAAEGWLDCYWTNRELTYACDDKFSSPSTPEEVDAHVAGTYPGPQDLGNKEGFVVYMPSIGANVEIFASPFRSVPYSVVVAAGQIPSYTSAEDADRLAASTALAQLQCIYCNPRINPVCVPDTIDPATAVLPLPLDSVDSSWSVDATLGVPGVVYGPVSSDPDVPWQPVNLFEDGSDELAYICTPDPFEASSIADTNGIIPARLIVPASRNANCRFGNDKIYAACNETGLPDISGDGILRFVPGGEFAGYYSPNSTTGYITVEKDQVLAESKVEANTIASVIALAQLNCFFESPNIQLFCGATTNYGTLPPAEAFRDPEWDATDPTTTFGNGTAGVLDELVHFTSTGYLTDGVHSSTPVFVDYGTGFSYSSPGEALAQAIQAGVGGFNCFFKEAATATCTPYPDTRSHHVTGRVNGYPSIPNNPALYGGYYDPVNQLGQIARYRHAGAVVPGIKNDPGTAVPNATASAISYVSKADASGQALAIAQGLLDCTHVNWYRDSNLCPPRHFNTAIGVVPTDTITSHSTEAANIQAEMTAIALTQCQEFAPFRLGAYPDPDGGGFLLRFTAGTVTAAGSDMSCAAGVEIGKVTRKLYWEDCDTPLAEDPYEFANGDYLFFVEAWCCGDELKYVITHQTTTDDITEFDYFPYDVIADKQSADSTKDYFYIGAVHADAEIPDAAGRGLTDLSEVAIYQSIDENFSHGTGVTRLRYAVSLNGEGEVVVAPGAVIYQRLRYKRPNDEDDEDVETRKQWMVGIFPKVDGTPINDTPQPTLGGVSDGDYGVWLICKDSQCGSFLPGEGAGIERVVLENDDDEPDLEIDECAVKLAAFTINTVGGSPVMEDLKAIWDSDWVQQFACEGDFVDSISDSITSSNPDPQSSSSGSGVDPDPSSSNSDSHDCNAGGWTFTLKTPPPDCFAPAPRSSQIFGPCEPGTWQMTLEVDIEKPAFISECEKWMAEITVMSGNATAFQANCVAKGGAVAGATHTVPLDCTGWKVDLLWRYYLPGGTPSGSGAPACQYLAVRCRVTSIAPEGDSTPHPCCGKSLSFHDLYRKSRFPRVCGDCACSGSQITET